MAFFTDGNVFAACNFTGHGIVEDIKMYYFARYSGNGQSTVSPMSLLKDLVHGSL